MRGFRPKIWSEAFSPTIMEGPFKFPFVILGKIELSATLRFSTPITLQEESTTAFGSAV